MNAGGNNYIWFSMCFCILLGYWEKIPIESHHVIDPLYPISLVGWCLHENERYSIYRVQNLFSFINFNGLRERVHGIGTKYRSIMTLHNEIFRKPVMSSPTIFKHIRCVMIPQPNVLHPFILPSLRIRNWTLFCTIRCQKIQYA